MNIHHLINKAIRDKNNKIVIWQNPNVPLLAWFICGVAARLFHVESLRTGFADLSTAFLFAWAYLEITQGASYARRLLGAVVACAIVAQYFAS